MTRDGYEFRLVRNATRDRSNPHKVYAYCQACQACVLEEASGPRLLALRDLSRTIRELDARHDCEGRRSATMALWRAPSGRLHSMLTCSGGAFKRMDQVRVTRAEYNAATLCRCVRQWRAEVGGSDLPTHPRLAEGRRLG